MGIDLVRASVGQYLQKVNAMIKQASGPKEHALYVDNQGGDFSFTSGELVAEVVGIDNSTDLSLTKTRIENNTPGMGDRIIDLRTGEQHTWSASVWSQQLMDLDITLKPGRLCFCPNTRKAFYRDLDGVVRQILQ